MIVVHMDLDEGFRKADNNSVPLVRQDAIVDFVQKCFKGSGRAPRSADNVDLRIDYVQVKRTGDLCEVRSVVFAAGEKSSSFVSVIVKVNEKKNEIIEAECNNCIKKDSCEHVMTMIFWLNRISTDTSTPALRDFWGYESEDSGEEDERNVLRIRDLFAGDELRIECDEEATGLTEEEGNVFLESVLDEIEVLGLRDSNMFRHCRTTFDEFEPLFLHHTLLDATNNCVKDVRSLVQYLEEHSKQGLFDRLTEVTRTCYKSSLWMEVQYMRIRCTLVHRIATRKDNRDDGDILKAMFCNNRTANTEDRQQLKIHKRFILKQTEKLENKTYSECGILLNDNYPYMCTSPDGITDDHIVEIKAPKTEEEFEKYLEGRETISPKYMAQIQVQMYLANVTKALYCVLSPTFDINGALHYVWVQADMEFVATLLSAAEDFWRDVVFPHLTKLYNVCP